MSDTPGEEPPYTHKLVLVPAGSIRALSRSLVQHAVVDGGTYEVAGDVTGDGPPRPISPEDIDRWTRHLLHASQHNRMPIGLGGRLQEVLFEMREAAGLPEFGWNDAVPDAEFGECSVHVTGCQGQETHP